MDIGDIIGIVFVLLIVGAFVLPWIRGVTSPPSGTNGRAVSAGPKSFTESGGYRPVARRPVQVQVPAPPERGAVRLAVEDVLEQAPSTDPQPAAEERTRRRPIAPLIVLTPETETAGQIRLQFGSRQAVRTAIIMREVLDPPMGLREES